MTKLTVSLQPQEGCKKYVYNYCNVSFELTLDKSLRCADFYTMLLYNCRLMLLGGAKTGDDIVQQKGKTFKVTFCENHIWIPGNYFFLLRNGDGMVLRFNLLLDEYGTFHTEKPFSCPRMSDEDILSGRIYDKRAHWIGLSRTPGATQLKKWVMERIRKNELNFLRFCSQKEKLELCNNLLISSKTPRLVGPSLTLLLHAAAVDTERQFADCGTFYDTTRNNPYEAMNEFFGDDSNRTGNLFSIMMPSEKPQTYVFSGISSLTENGGKMMMKAILRHWPGSGSSAIFYGTQQEINSLLDQNPSLQKHFPPENRLFYEPYSLEEMLHTLFAEIQLAHLQFSAEATDRICRVITQAYERGAIGHWDKLHIREYVEQKLLPKHCQNAICGIAEGKDSELLTEVQVADIDEQYFLSLRSTYNDILADLNAMVGLREIKQSITTLARRMNFTQMRRQFGLHSSEDTTYHAIFTGNPGTGKTTVARLLGRIYYSLGLLSKGEVVYADRTKIIGKFIGETEENMKQILKEAQGNVLFIDEAYTLYNRDDARDFGRHAVECLLDVLTRKDPDMLIIFAGYEKEMDALMSMNPGLVGRFPYKYCFQDYSAEELLQIAEHILQRDEYVLTPEAKTLLTQTVRATVACKTEHFANARWMEQFVRNGIIPALAERVSRIPTPDRWTFQRIEAEDVRVAAAQFNSKTIELKRRNVIGFCA